jgi:hypothetical protein
MIIYFFILNIMLNLITKFLKILHYEIEINKLDLSQSILTNNRQRMYSIFCS